MRVDAANSIYQEDPAARQEFNSRELKSLRLLLRRLRFLEAQIERSGGLSAKGGSGGAAFAEWEADALEWVLVEVGFLSERREG